MTTSVVFAQGYATNNEIKYFVNDIFSHAHPELRRWGKPIFFTVDGLEDKVL